MHENWSDTLKQSDHNDMKSLAGEQLAIFSGQQRVDWRLCSDWRRVPAGASLLPPTVI